MKRNQFYLLSILLILFILLSLMSQVTKYRRLPYSLETYPWKSIEVCYCVGEGPVVIKKNQRIDDRDTLDRLKSQYKPIEYENLVLHYADCWNRIHVTLVNGQEAMLVLGRNDACYYASNWTPIGIRLEDAFKSELITILQKNEEMPVHLHHNRFEITVENQSPSIEPSISGWILK